MSAAEQLTVTSAPYGNLADGRAVTEYTLTNGAESGIEVKVINYGAIITSVLQGDRTGKKQQVVLGYDNINSWQGPPQWINCLCGRSSNRIRDGKFSIDDQSYQLEKNNLGNNLHTGAAAFNAKLMDAKTISGKDDVQSSKEYVGVEMSFVSPDGEFGFPGELAVKMLFKLFGDNTLQMEFLAEVKDKPTIVNMVNHTYWNLSGRLDQPDSTILEHTLQVHADAHTELDGKETMLTTGRILQLADTVYDFRQPRAIGSRLAELNKTIPSPGGYDNNFVLNKDFVETAPTYMHPHEVREGLRASFTARLADPSSGRVMDVYTTAPGVQVYTGNFLDGKEMVGRGGVAYPKHGGICLETQVFPDAINHAKEWVNFASPILRPGEKYVHITQHVFHTNA